MIEGLICTPLKQIENPRGNIFHVMKNSSSGYLGFGEAYISHIYSGDVKGWKKHTDMTLNLTVLTGEVKFVIFDDRPNSSTCNVFEEVVLSPQDNYSRLTVPPQVWVAFKGVDTSVSMILNIADIEHTPAEAESVVLDRFTYEWGTL